MTEHRENKGNNSLYTLGFLALVAAAIILIIGLSRYSEKYHPFVGKTAPSVELHAVQGTRGNPMGSSAKLTLEQFKGKVVVLDFWAVWCGPCRQSMPHVQALSKKFEPEGVIVLGVLVDSDRMSAREFLRKNEIDYLQLDDDDNVVSKAYEVTSLPTLVILDRQHRIHAYRKGVVEPSELEALVRKAM